MKFIRSVLYIINYKTLIVTSLAVVATWFCLRIQLYAEFPLTIVGIAIVFPIVFSINSAYRRRERALRALADATGNAVGIYQIAKNQMKNPGAAEIPELRLKLISLFLALKVFLEGPPKNAKKNEEEIYRYIDEISRIFRQLRQDGLAGRFVARISQYLTQITVAIDNMKVIYKYRTPRTLRAYSKVFIFSFPILYAPYFANTAVEYSLNLSYMMPVLFSFILVSLDNIQEHLEDPYDQIGEDDISMDMDEIEAMLI